MTDDSCPTQEPVPLITPGGPASAPERATLAPLPHVGSTTHDHSDQAEISDEQLATALIAALDADHFVPRDAITVTVRESIATLTGAVSWDYQRTAAQETAALVPGIAGTHNNIALQPHAWQQPDRPEESAPRRPALVAKDAS